MTDTIHHTIAHTITLACAKKLQLAPEKIGAAKKGKH